MFKDDIVIEILYCYENNKAPLADSKYKSRDLKL